MKIIFEKKAARLWLRKPAKIALVYPEIWELLEEIRNDHRKPSASGREYIESIHSVVVVVFYAIDRDMMYVHDFLILE